MSRVRTWVRDLALGARFAVTGGRRGWTRTILTTIGVGLGVCLLLAAASVPHLLDSRDDRVAGRTAFPVVHPEVKPSERSFLYAETSTLYRGDTVKGMVVRPDGGRAPAPPGLTKLPGPGEMAVSPALADLLVSPEGALLKDRLPYRITATIGDQGLVGPGELFYYAGSNTLKASAVERSDRFDGGSDSRVPMDAGLLLIVVMACVVLLLPVAVFIATAARFGSEQRDRRLAALRLVGSDRAMTRRIAAGESFCEALFGLAAGAGTFMLVRQFLGSVTIWDINAFPSDVAPNPALTALIIVSVPVCAIAVTLFTLRGVAIEPLGVVRNTAPRRRRLWWRVLLPVAGLALLLPQAGQVGMNDDTDIATYQISGGALLVLIGITALLPWLVEAVVGRLHGGPVSWQLAVRRIQLSSGTAARAVTGIMVAAAGGIALQMLVASMQSDFMKPTGMDTARAQLFTSAPGADATSGREIIEKYSATKGVSGVIGIIETYAERPGPQRSGERWVPVTGLTVGDCPSLRELAKLPSCKDGDVFIATKNGKLRPKDEDPAQPGAQVDLSLQESTPSGTVKRAEPELWRIPASARTAQTRSHPMGRLPLDGILATPSAIDVSKLHDATTTAMIRLDPKVPDAAEYARNTAAAIDPVTDVQTMQNFERDSRYSSVLTGVFVGAAVTMLVVAASMLVSTLQQLRERKQLLSVLVAFGTRRTTLSWSVLWQTAIPVVMGLALAVTTGIGLGLTLLNMVDKQVTDWWAFLPIIGVGAGLILLVTLLSLPPLWRMTRPDGLRTE